MALSELTRETVVGVETATAPKELFSITNPHCSAILWHREPLRSFQSWIDNQCPENLPRARVVLPVDAVHDAVSELAAASGLPEAQERSLLVDDISALANIFAGVVRTSFLRLRLDVVTTDACPKFHTDAVTARLICTYRGTGTEFGNAEDGSDPSEVFTAPTGSPLLLKGSLWPQKPKSSLLHRSPPIERTGQTRLVLVLDPAIDPGGEPALAAIH